MIALHLISTPSVFIFSPVTNHSSGACRTLHPYQHGRPRSHDADTPLPGGRLTLLFHGPGCGRSEHDTPEHHCHWRSRRKINNRMLANHPALRYICGPRNCRHQSPAARRYHQPHFHHPASQVRRWSPQCSGRSVSHVIWVEVLAPLWPLTHLRYVAFTSGLAVVTLPDSDEKATIHGGKYGLIIAADIASVSKTGHITRYPSGSTTTALQIRMKDNTPPAHSILHKGACRRVELVGL